MTATVELPGAARIDDAGPRKDVVIIARRRLPLRRGAPSSAPGAAAGPSVLVLRRESTLPIMRVSPAEYAAVAADLRRVDGAEQEEIRIRLQRPARGAPR